MANLFKLQVAATMMGLVACAAVAARAQTPADTAADSSSGAPAAVPTHAEVEQQAAELFGKVMSPFCPGRTIANCPSPQAADLQIAIKDKLANGESPDEIEAELYTTFGDDIRAIPRARGFNLLAWAVPVLFFGLGVVVLVRWLRGLAPAAPAVADQGTVTQGELDERLKRELTELGD